MPLRRLAGTPLDFGAIRIELGVPGEFASAALSDAATAAQRAPAAALDRTELEFLTVDPAGSRDLDQAVHIARKDDGYVVSYAIADLAFFIDPDSALDRATRERGETYYFPDARVPLHPTVLSEGAASLLPNQPTPAVLWQMTLDARGTVTATSLARALVCSRRQWDYVSLQKALDDGSAPETAVLLREVGELRIRQARARHAMSLDLPEQTVERAADGSWSLSLRATLPVEAANAEISLMTGMCAAQIMLEGRVGLLRVVPEPAQHTIDALKRIAPALGVSWPDGAWPGDVLATLDTTNDRHAAFVDHAASLMRGAGYVAFDGSVPDEHVHYGIAAPYAHVTAPLRRLPDRIATEVCLALHAGQPVPSWALAALPQLPALMQRADALAHASDRAVVDATEAFLLQHRVGEAFAAVVLEADQKAATIAIEHPAVRARCDGAGLRPGSEVSVRLTQADVASRTVRFALA